MSAIAADGASPLDRISFYFSLAISIHLDVFAFLTLTQRAILVSTQLHRVTAYMLTIFMRSGFQKRTP